MNVLEVTEAEENELVKGRPYLVPTGEQHGGWERRPSLPAGEEVRARWTDAPSQISLGSDGCLDGTSLKRLEALGVSLHDAE